MPTTAWRDADCSNLSLRAAVATVRSRKVRGGDADRTSLQDVIGLTSFTTFSVLRSRLE